jgi:transcriptional regulator with XRE-family HTH domain
MRYGAYMDTRQRQVGEQLREAREARGLSKRKAAHIAGVSESRWRQVESGVQYRDGQPQPASSTPDTLVRMARAVGLDAGDILEEFGFDRGIAQHIPEQKADEIVVNPSAPDQPPSRVISLEEFSPTEENLIRMFLLNIQANREATKRED